MSEQGFNIWGAVAGVLGTLALLPIIWCFLRTRLPSEKLRSVDMLLFETEQLLNSGVEEGLLSAEEFRILMWSTKHDLDDLRAQIYNTTTWKEEYRNWRNGFTDDMNVMCQKLNHLKAAIAHSSAEERQKLGAAGRTTDFILSARMREAYCPAEQQAKLGTQIPASSTMLATFHSAPSPTTLRPDTSERPTHQSVRQNDQASSPSSTVCHEPIVQQACNAKGHSLGDPDLEELLTLIAARRARRPADAKSKPGRFLPRQDLLQRFGRQLSSPDPSQTASSPTELVPQPQAKRVSLKESLARLFRSAYSRPPHTGLEGGHHR